MIKNLYLTHEMIKYLPYTHKHNTMTTRRPLCPLSSSTLMSTSNEGVLTRLNIDDMDDSVDLADIVDINYLVDILDLVENADYVDHVIRADRDYHADLV